MNKATTATNNVRRWPTPSAGFVHIPVEGLHVAALAPCMMRTNQVGSERCAPV